jgi:hypothetical protein
VRVPLLPLPLPLPLRHARDATVVGEVTAAPLDPRALPSRTAARALKERPTTVTAAPLDAAKSANARPTPDVPPITATVLPFRSSADAATAATVMALLATPCMLADGGGKRERALGARLRCV